MTSKDETLQRLAAAIEALTEQMKGLKVEWVTEEKPAEVKTPEKPVVKGLKEVKLSGYANIAGTTMYTDGLTIDHVRKIAMAAQRAGVGAAVKKELTSRGAAKVSDLKPVAFAGVINAAAMAVLQSEITKEQEAELGTLLDEIGKEANAKDARKK